MKKYLDLKNNIVAEISCLLTIACCFLPFLTLDYQNIHLSYTFLDNNGIVIVILMSISFILIIIKKEMFSIISSSLALIYGIYLINNIQHFIPMMKTVDLYSLISSPFSNLLFLMIIISITAVLYKQIDKKR